MGREDFTRELQSRNVNVELNDKKVKALFTKKGAKTVEDLYYEIGKNTISPGSAVNALIDKIEYTDQDLIQKINTSVYLDQKSDSNIIVEGLKTAAIKLSNCCTPIPGDKIKGYVSKGVGIAVHREDCNNLKSLDKNRYIDVFWGNDKTKQYTVNLRVIVSNRDNVLAEIINSVTSSAGKVQQVAASTNKLLEVLILSLV